MKKKNVLIALLVILVLLIGWAGFTKAGFIPNFTESDLRYFNATKPNQVHAASNMLTSSFGIQTPVQDIDFNMYIDDEMHCRYSTNEIEFSQMTKTLACLGAPLEVSDIGVFRCRDNIKFNETIFIQCQDAVTENRNTNSEGYLISLRR